MTTYADFRVILVIAIIGFILIYKFYNKSEVKNENPPS